MNAKNPELSGRTYYLFEEPEQTDLVDISNQQMICMTELNEEPAEVLERKPGFWRRQFQGEVTRGQIKFDWIFGVILPVICIYFDPVVFRHTFGSEAYMGRIAIFSYVLSFTAILATIAWLLWRGKLKWLNAPLSGLFAVSSVTAFAIGILIAPISAIGLIILIGALGFTPLFCSFVLLRNSIRAYRAARPSLDKDFLQSTFALSAVASAVIPYLLNLW
jgi:hypothetical protein